MNEEYVGKVLTFERAYKLFAGFNFAMVELVKNERGKHYKGKVICVSNDPEELREALAPYDGQSRALLQGYMDDIVAPVVADKPMEQKKGATPRKRLESVTKLWQYFRTIQIK